MNIIHQVLYLSSVFIVVKSFQPNCHNLNQFRSYCIPIEYCDEYNCDFSGCGFYSPISSLVRIKSTKIIPTCAFTNSDNLRDIHGVQKRIEVIASQSFVNLPNLRSILLSFNLIRELHSGIFLGVSVKILDLSWNRLVYISDGAFQGLNRLEYLNLSRNELKTLPITPMPSSLIEIKLSNNFFDTIIMSSKKTPNILDIDLSHNVLQKVAFSFEHKVKKIDLSNNELKTLDFIELPTCEELKLRSNSFSSVPEILMYLNIERISLYPNPWSCNELRKLWKYLENNYVIVIDENEGGKKMSKPICQASFKAAKLLGTEVKLNNRKKCKNNKECGDNMVCRSKKCWNPCVENACDSSSICEVKKHEVNCTCPKNLRRNPKDIYSLCLNTECFVNLDCADKEKYCNWNNTCVQNLGLNGSPGIPPFFINPVPDEPWWYDEIPKYFSRNRILD